MITDDELWSLLRSFDDPDHLDPAVSTSANPAFLFDHLVTKLNAESRLDLPPDHHVEHTSDTLDITDE